MTRRLITIKWLFYSLWTLLFLLVQQLVLPYIRIWGVHPFLLPALAAVAASFEGRWEGPIYGLVLGLICDLLFPGAFPCFYAITLLLSAVVSASVLVSPPPQAVRPRARAPAMSRARIRFFICVPPK